MAQQCLFIKPDGTQCGGYATNGSAYCISHNPALAETKAEAVKKGGASEGYQKLNLDLAPLTIQNPSDVVTAIVQTINEVRSGTLPPKIASTLGYLLGIALKAFEVSELDSRLEVIERIILERKTSERRLR